MTDETKLNKIRLLLAKAESTNSESEAEALQAKAFELIAKYGLEEAMLAADKGDGGRQANRQSFVIEGTYHQRRMLLLVALLKAMRCRALLLTTKGRSKNTVVVGYGMPADLERVEILFRSLDLQMGAALKRSLVSKPKGVHGKTWSVNFMDAFAYRIGERVQAAENQAVQDENQFGGDRFALVLATEAEKVQALFDKDNPKVRSVHMATTKNSWGMGEGDRAGRQARIGSGSGQVGSGRIALNR